MFFGVVHAGAARFCGKVAGFTMVLMVVPALTACLGNNGPGVVAVGEPTAQSPPASNIAVTATGTAPPIPAETAPVQAAMPARAPVVAKAKVYRPPATIAERQPPLQRPPTTALLSGEAPAIAAPATAAAPHAPKVVSRNSRPARPAERHVLKFYAPVVKVYDKPYGTVTAQMQAAQFPKERLAFGGEGVPVYKDGTAFVELAVASDSTGWVKIEDVAMSAKPCKVDPRPSLGSPGPIGAGSSSAACVR